MKKRYFFLITILFLTLIPYAANADCSSPSAPAGTLDYNSSDNLYYVCDGTDWISTCARTDPSLIGHWRLDDITSNFVPDYSGNENHGTFMNKASYTPTTGAVDTSIDFDGSNDYVNIPRDASLEPSTAITMAAWIKWDDATTSFYAKIFGKGSTPFQTFSLGQYAATAQARAEFVINGTLRTSNLIAITIDEWAHIAVTWESGSPIKFYLNGVLAHQSPSYSGSLSYNDAYDLRIGDNANNENNNEFDGEIDDVRLYNRVLSLTEIQRLHAVTSVKEYPQPVLHWKLDETSGTTIIDYSGNGNDGETQSGLTFTSDSITGVFGGGIEMSGTNDHMEPDDDSNEQFDLEDMTLMAWIKPDLSISPNNGSIPIIEHRGGGANYLLEIEGSRGGPTANTGKVKFVFNNGSWPAHLGTQVLTDNVWQHIALTYNQTTRQYVHYYNGSPAGSGTTSVPVLINTTNTLAIGRSDDQTNNPSEFKGGMDEIKIYNTALTAQQVETIYNNSVNIEGCERTEACANPGEINYEYSRNSLEFCDGAYKKQIGTATTTACTTEGEINYNTGTDKFEFCNGEKLFAIP